MSTVQTESRPAPPPPPPPQPVAAVLAWLFPGAGHLYLGHTRRAILICLGVLGLFSGGLFVGGISCVDRKEAYFWYLGQAMTGPIALGVDYVHQHWFKALSETSFGNVRDTDDLERMMRGSMQSPRPGEIRVIRERSILDKATGKRTTVRLPVFAPAPAGEPPPYVKSLGRVNELGTLFCTIAGFMNLICIVDAAQLHRRDRRKNAGTRAMPATGGAA